MILTHWSQSHPYNKYCPEDPEGSGGRVVVGCTALSMAQVIKYHNYPQQGTGYHSYYHNQYGNLSANYGNTTYEWTHMPNRINEHYEAVALLLYHCGVSVEMNYGPTASGAWPDPDAYTNYFGYSSQSDYVSEDDYNATSWKNLIKTEIDNLRPTVYDGGSTSDEVLHTFYGDDDPVGEDIISSANKLLVQFITDGSGPCNYFGNKICTWEIPAGSDECVVVEFTEFDLSYFKHYVRISEGSTELVKYTNEDPPSGPVTANGPEIKIRFSTALTDGTTGEGWAFNYYTTVGINETTGNNLLNMQVYPNPVNSGTLISYDLSETGDITITISGIPGKDVGVISTKQINGHHEVRLSDIVRYLESGIYLVNIKTDKFTATKKFIWY